MRTIIAGSRGFSRGRALVLVDEAVTKSGFTPTKVLSGGAEGIDLAGEAWAQAHGIPVDRHPAQWRIYGRVIAGRARNLRMAQLADALVAIWDGCSPGTRHMIETAEQWKLKVFVLNAVKDLL